MKRGFNYKKATQVLNFFACKEGGTINKMKSLKLLWLADRFHLRMYGRSISSDSYLAMKNGPVPSGTKNIAENNNFCLAEHKIYGQQYIRQTQGDIYFIESVNEPDVKVFSKTDLAALEKVYTEFGSKNQFQLSEYSHLYPEWTRWESSLRANPNTCFPVTEEDFFADPPTERAPLFEESEERINTNREQYFAIEEY